eukprot:CAMPEP_0204243872 /NCGR_PEP_ID=MMETSP0361-20130328/96656_1 /ASSEMBLY_ACC=CAM_ASM_000343 /TAXON_ID=268821 /ORGANISM="Scrippsiella Hangoei, Strain SHTV-5" /LENGTH=77 /DNA_ID=CAMNT_0051216779 /DNA_START=154 /DNA_END=384 /DNA_ORIENTATION=+
MMEVPETIIGDRTGLEYHSENLGVATPEHHESPSLAASAAQAGASFASSTDAPSAMPSRTPERKRSDLTQPKRCLSR